MLRIFVINSLMFLLPFMLYGAYFYLAHKGADLKTFWADAPLLWLLGAGAALVLGAMAALVSFGGAKPGGTYVPPRLEDGVIKPGHVE